MRQHLRFCTAFVVLFSFCSLLKLNAQESRQKTIERLQSDEKLKTFSLNETLGTISFLSFKDQAVSKESIPQTLKNYFNLSQAGEQLQLLRTAQLQSGIVVDRYRLSYNNIPVEHSAYVVISRQGYVHSIFAESYDLSNLPQQPVLATDAKICLAKY
ncbi:MAG: hypothetical protein C4330_13960 [Chitinophagaceae bacterium]